MPLIGLLRGANNNDKDFLAGIYDDSKVIKLGRHLSNDVMIYWPFISDVHCEIHTSSNRDITNVYLTDKSENGTYFNGSLIGYNKSVILFNSSLISFVSSHLNLSYIRVNTKQSQNESNTFNIVLEKPFKEPKTITVTNIPIGSGAESQILLAYDYLRSRYEIVCKIPRKTVMKRRMNNYQKKEIVEVDLLKKTRHPNVLSMIGNCIHPENTKFECFFFPLYAGGSLNDRIKRKQYLEEEEASFIFFQILHGLKYIHSQGIIHCDIKADNIFLSSQNDKTRAVIGDFGLAKRKDSQKWSDDQYGTWLNHAPEMLNEDDYDERIDIWSAGITLYLMLSGDHPFLETSELQNERIENYDKVCQRITDMDPLMRRARIQACSPEAHHLILSLLEKDPKKRYTASEALKDAFFLNKAVTDQLLFFEEYQRYVKDDFNQERAHWFGETVDECQLGEGEDKDRIHPDDDLEEVSKLIKFRSSHSMQPIFKAKKKVEFDAGREEEIYNQANRERYPKRSFRNNKRSSSLFRSDYRSNSSSSSSSSKSDQEEVDSLDQEEFSVGAD